MLDQWFSNFFDLSKIDLFFYRKCTFFLEKQDDKSLTDFLYFVEFIWKMKRKYLVHNIFQFFNSYTLFLFIEIFGISTLRKIVKNFIIPQKTFWKSLFWTSDPQHFIHFVLEFFKVIYRSFSVEIC